MAAPIPLPAPVTIAVRPDKSARPGRMVAATVEMEPSAEGTIFGMVWLEVSIVERPFLDEIP